VWQTDLEMLCPDIVEETDTIAYGIGCRETVLRQLNLLLHKLRAKGVQQQGHAHLLKMRKTELQQTRFVLPQQSTHWQASSVTAAPISIASIFDRHGCCGKTPQIL
jgi:hypothetical protein